MLSRDEFKGGIASLGVSDEDAAAVVQEVLQLISFTIDKHLLMYLSCGNVQCFEEIDKDGSGTLSIQELIAWVDSD